MPIIRKAKPSDAMQLSRVEEDTFRATFGAVNTAKHMTLYCSSNFSEDRQAKEISNPDMVTLLSLDNDEIIGFAQLRWGDVPDCVVSKFPSEIQRLYVVNDWHGKAVAQDLMAACVEETKQRGSDAIWLGVWELNPRAISFYKKLEFVEVGDHIFALGGDPQRDIVMHRTLAVDKPTI